MAKILNKEQTDQIVEWIGHGYTDTDIVIKIETDRSKGAFVGTDPWPEISRQHVRYYRTRYGKLSKELQVRAFDIQIQTGLAQRVVMAKRLVTKIGKVEEIIDKMVDAMEYLMRDQVFTSFAVAQDPNIVDAEAVYLEAEVRKLVPQMYFDEPVADKTDWRWERAIDLMNIVPKWLREYIALMKALQSLNPAEKDSGDDPKKRQETAKRLLEELREEFGGDDRR